MMFGFPRVELKPEELKFLVDTFGKDKVIVEIGCYAGRTTLLLANDNIVVAVDPYTEDFEQDDLETFCLQDAKNLFTGRIKNRNIIWHEGKSEDVVKNWKFPIDCIFIDGEHTYKGLEKDCEWIKHIKKGGLVAFHDYDNARGFPEVNDYINKNIKPNMELVGHVGYTIIFRKI